MWAIYNCNVYYGICNSWRSHTPNLSTSRNCRVVLFLPLYDFPQSRGMQPHEKVIQSGNVCTLIAFGRATQLLWQLWRGGAKWFFVGRVKSFAENCQSGNHLKVIVILCYSSVSGFGTSFCNKRESFPLKLITFTPPLQEFFLVVSVCGCKMRSSSNHLLKTWVINYGMEERLLPWLLWLANWKRWLSRGTERKR